ncbi:hypothetical protein [Bacillus wiedmannii]|uniref:hypothetical protein n=1 Tax=Bacillus wiedmannii TaxID=1890302 RepID=UPI003CF6EDC6
MNNKKPEFQDSEINGVTVDAKTPTPVTIGLGNSKNKQIIDFEYIYEGSQYPRTVVPTEVIRGKTEWNIIFYNMHHKDHANITVKARFGLID